MEVETTGRRATQKTKGEIVSAGGGGGYGGGSSSSSSSSSSEESNCVDWRGRPSNPTSHGGMKAAVFVLGLQAFEIMGIGAVGNNLITYLINEMHFPLPKSANIVTNFIGTIFLLSLFGGYLSDSFLGSFWTMLIFGFVELSGFILLSVQAHVPQLKPPKCSNAIQDPGSCVEARGFKSLIFFVALYLVALGSGCVKPNMLAHGADQFNAHTDPKHARQLSTYFNAAYLAFSVGEIVALTLLVWVQTHSGMDIGFGISAAVMACGLVCLVSGILVYRHKRPQGSIFTPIAQVIVAAIAKRKQVWPSNVKQLYGSQSSAPNSYNNNTGRFGAPSSSNNSLPHALPHTDRFRCLDKACIQVVEDNKKESPWRLCTTTQVEQVKILISVLPIFSCTIIFNTLLAQLQTFSVQQGSQMNSKLSPSFSIPPASLQSIPYLMLLFVVPMYDKFFVPLARKFTGHQTGITPLQRIGSGLFIATFSMVSAAIIEKKRRDHAEDLSIFWLTPQFLIFGVSEMLTAVGMIEFFYKQSVLLRGMQAFLMAVTYCSYSFGFYLSSVLVSLVNKVTAGAGWLSDNDLNKDRLDLFYWLLAALSLLNFFQYVFWSKWYSNNPSVVLQQHVSPEEQEDEELGAGYVDRHGFHGTTSTQKERIGGKMNAAAAAAAAAPHGVP